MNNRFPPLHSTHISDADYQTKALVEHDHGVRGNADVEVVFRNIESRLIDEINKADAVFGCVAWLTHVKILEALASKDSCGIVVQKEDFLRPDSRDLSRARTRQLYGALKGFYRLRFLSTSHYSTSSDPISEGVRCVGYHNAEQRGVIPRMHNKFLVFCRNPKPDLDGDYGRFEPYAVWTGSFNMTFNAADSIENALIIRDGRIAHAYADEFGTIFGLSEPLDWTSSWAAPEYRIGT